MSDTEKPLSKALRRELDLPRGARELHRVQGPVDVEVEVFWDGDDAILVAYDATEPGYYEALEIKREAREERKADKAAARKKSAKKSSKGHRTVTVFG